MNMIKSYKDLHVYQRSYKLALDIHRLSFTLPEFEKYELRSQLRRSAVSIPLNIAEGYGRKDSKAEFKHFLRNSLGSCNEVQVLLNMIKDLGYIEEELYSEFAKSYEIVGKQLNKLIKNWQTFQPPTSNI
jgi:four helix bundle protein